MRVHPLPEPAAAAAAAPPAAAVGAADHRAAKRQRLAVQANKDGLLSARAAHGRPDFSRPVHQGCGTKQCVLQRGVLTASRKDNADAIPWLARASGEHIVD